MKRRRPPIASDWVVKTNAKRPRIASVAPNSLQIVPPEIRQFIWDAATWQTRGRLATTCRRAHVELRAHSLAKAIPQAWKRWRKKEGWASIVGTAKRLGLDMLATYEWNFYVHASSFFQFSWTLYDHNTCHRLSISSDRVRADTGFGRDHRLCSLALVLNMMRNPSPPPEKPLFDFGSSEHSSSSPSSESLSSSVELDSAEPLPWSDDQSDGDL